MKTANHLVVVGVIVLLVAIGITLNYAPYSRAETQDCITDVSAVAYTINSTNYDDLVCMSAAIPSDLEGYEWVHGIDGFWHNINMLSSNYGDNLTYSDIPYSNGKVVSDVSSYTGVFGSDWFALIQVSYTVCADSVVKITVTCDNGFHYTKEISENGVKVSEASDYYYVFNEYESL